MCGMWGSRDSDWEILKCRAGVRSLMLSGSGGGNNRRRADASAYHGGRDNTGTFSRWLAGGGVNEFDSQDMTAGRGGVIGGGMLSCLGGRRTCSSWYWRLGGEV